jgi:hypothetical protein
MRQTVAGARGGEDGQQRRIDLLGRQRDWVDEGAERAAR